MDERNKKNQTHQNMKNFQTEICPQCQLPKMKNWEELDDKQKFLVERLPRNAEFSREERKKHRFCERCWFEDVQAKTEKV